MIPHLNYGMLLGAVAFIGLGLHQFHLRKHVDELERVGKLTSEAAARIRKKPMRRTGWICVAAGMCFLLLSFLHS
jgi:hypothetical protein